MKNKVKNPLKRRLFLALFSLFFVLASFLTILPKTSVYAEQKDETSETSTEESEKTEKEKKKDEEEKKELKEQIENICNDESGAIGWIICPSSGALSKAVDSIYGTIEEFLVINPIPANDSSTIHIVWESIRNITNIVFIVFLLVIVYSHLTGFGITNYNLKRILPRLIVVAILVNISFFICQVAVDVSNLIGHGLRGFFTTIEEDAILRGTFKAVDISWTDLVDFVTGAATAASITISLTGGIVALFWTLVPVLVGAIVSVAIGFITIAMRQAVVSVLIMLAPLAFVCFLLPNTEKWFKKWKDALFSMLVFFPAFSFLFGASHLAGWAIITSSVNEAGETSGFGVLLGLAVQIFPLFFSWSLMKMSNTILGTVSQKLQGFSQKPLGAISRLSAKNKEFTKSKYIGGTPKGIGQETMQRIHDRQTRKEEDIARYTAQAKLRGQAYASRLRNRKGYTKRAEEIYNLQADSMSYQEEIEQSKTDLNKGLGAIMNAEIENGYLIDSAKNRQKLNRLNVLDQKNVNASDNLKFAQVRAEKVEYDNAVGFYERVEQAFDAHIDEVKAGDDKHQIHTYLDEGDNPKRLEAKSRYETIKRIMEGEEIGTYFVKATSTSNFATKAKIIGGKFETAYALTPATQDLEDQLHELTSSSNSTKNIDHIISGLRILNQRGDTNIVKRLLDETFADGKIKVGTHASQSLANFLMFDVKDNDPALRRFGKYINLETAKVYNYADPRDRRLRQSIDYNEYITGEYLNPDGSIGYSKKSAVDLMEGTSLDNVERTFYSNLDESLQKAYLDAYGEEYIDENGDTKRRLTQEGLDKFKKKRKEIYNSMAPAFISASLKYPSGSEQLVSAVSYMTGLKESVAKDESGTPLRDEDGKLIKEIRKRWEDKSDPLYGLDEDYFRECSENYLKDQIPNQILSMRTDYRSTLTNHLFNSIISSSEEQKASAKRAFGEILGIDDLSDDEFEQLVRGVESVKDESVEGSRTIHNDDREKRKRINDYMLNLAGVKAREIWEKNGTLAQLYTSRRSGTANNAKPFVRNWANLDNESEIRAYLKEKAREEREARRRAGDPDVDSGDAPIHIYTDSDRESYQLQIDDMLDSIGENPSDFYRKTRRYILNTLGLSYIASEYEDYYRNNNLASASDLASYLKQLLDDEENYPSS